MSPLIPLTMAASSDGRGNIVGAFSQSAVKRNQFVHTDATKAVLFSLTGAIYRATACC